MYDFFPIRCSIVVLFYGTLPFSIPQSSSLQFTLIFLPLVLLIFDRLQLAFREILAFATVQAFHFIEQHRSSFELLTQQVV